MPPFFFSSSSLHLPSSSHLSKLFHLSSSFQHHSTRYHRRNHTMACVCGCDRDDHLHNLQSGSPSFSSAFKEPGGPSFDEKLTNRFQLNQEEIEPSKSIPRRPKDGGDAQSQECAKSPNPFDSNRSPLSLPLPRLEELTSGDQMTKDALMQDWHRDSDNPRGAQKPRRTSNVEQAFQVLWPPTKGVMRASSFERRKMISSFSLPNTLAQPTADLSMKLATQSLPIRHGQSYRTSCSPPQLNRHACSERWSPLEFNQHRRPISQDFSNLTLTERENRTSTKRQAEAVFMEDPSSSETADSDTSIPEGCLCGCGGNAIRCLRPNRPPSPNTFENSWAPEFASILRTRLDAVAANLEPSRRIWWREEFGGCAPDREPLFSETWNRKWGDRENVLRTSPPRLYDSATVRRLTQFKASPTQRRVPSLPNRRIRSLHKLDDLPQNCQRPLNNASRSVPRYKSGRFCERAVKDVSNYYTDDRRGRSLFRELIVARTAKPLKSPTHYVPDKLPALKIPEFSKDNQLVPKREQLTLEERQQRRQSALQKLEASRLEMQRRLADPEQRKLFLVGDPFLTSKCDDVKESPSDVEVMKKAVTTEEPQRLSCSLYQKIEEMKMRRNCRHGVALYGHERLATSVLPYSPQAHYLRKFSSSITGPGEKSQQIHVKDPCVTKSNPRNTEGFQSRYSSVPIRGFGCQGVIFNHVGRSNQGHPIRHSM